MTQTMDTKNCNSCSDETYVAEWHSNHSLCNFEISDGNRDDPSYAYCGFIFAHGGEHGNWKI